MRASASGEPEIAKQNSRMRNHDVESAGRVNRDARGIHVPNRGIIDGEDAACSASIVENPPRGSPKVPIHQAVLDIDFAVVGASAAADAYRNQAAVEAVKVDVAQANRFPRLANRRKVVERNIYSVGPGVKDRGEDFMRVDRNRLGDSYGTVTCRIKRIDLAVHSRLRDGTCESLARGRSAAWVGIVTHAGYPGSRCLTESTRGKAGGEENPEKETQDVGRLH